MDRKETVELKDGRLLGFAEYGDPNGLPIFYFHGFPGSRLEASRFHDVAADNGYRIIGIDRPGMGLSSIDKNRSMLSWATDVAHFADYLEIEKFSIIGHSGGGAFVAACAYAIPNRLNGAAIVSGMAPFDNPESLIGMPRGQIIANKLIKNRPWLANLMMKLTFMMLKNPKMMEPMIKQLPKIDQDLFRDPVIGKALINNTIEAFRNGVVGVAQEMKLLLNPWDFDLKNISVPITLWQGSLDPQVPMSHAKIYEKLIPGAQLKIIENEGHHSLITNHMVDILRGMSKY